MNDSSAISMNNGNKNDFMEIDGELNNTSNTSNMTSLAQSQSMNYMNRNNELMLQESLANYVKRLNALQDNSWVEESNGMYNTENYNSIAKWLKDNGITEQELLNIFNKNTIPNGNSTMEIGQYILDYIKNKIQNRSKEKSLNENLYYKYFKNQLNKDEALPIRRYIKDFNIDFEQKSQTTFKNPNEQSQYLRNSLTELQKRLLENPLWSNTTKEEQENAVRGMERLIITKHFNIIFGPPIDKERDELFSRKIHMHSWIEPIHLDLPNFNDEIFEKASNELSKEMNSHRYYIDKLICLENCIRLIEDAYKKNVSDVETFSDDLLLSLLIYLILKTNPKNIVSNIQYIRRYINPYYLSVGIHEESIANIWRSITFIEKITQASLNITAEEYAENIIEIAKMDIQKINDARNDNGMDSIPGNIIQSIKDYILGSFWANSSQNENDIQRNTSIQSNNSILVSDPQSELRENYLNNMNNPMTRPFESHLTEEEQKSLFFIDQDLKASLSINSTITIGRSESERDNDI